MNLFELISQEERDAMMARIYQSTGFKPKANLEYLLRHWEAAKHPLYKLLGDNLVISKEISYEKSISERYHELTKYDDKHGRFLNKIREAFYQRESENEFVYETVKEQNPDGTINYRFEAKVKDPEKITFNKELYHLLDSSALSKNIYSRPSFYFMSAKTGKKINICSGCKTIKALGKLIDEFDIDREVFEEFRLKHSMILNDASFHDTMYLSIHPLDYMTMSDNSHNWGSCMSWDDEGCYRQGTVEMMNSDCVVVAYLASDSVHYCPDHSNNDFHWNSKKWRELFVINENTLCGVKGYPYWNTSLEKIATEWLKELAEVNLGIEYSTYIKNFETGCRYPLVDADCPNVSINFETDFMYNDMSAGARPAYFNGKNHDSSYMTICYSGDSECLVCGGEFEPDDEDDGEFSLTCMSCFGYDCRCDECGHHGYKEDMYYINGEYYCECCYNDMATCAVCGELIPHSNDNRYVVISHNGKILRNLWEITIDPDCFDVLFDKGDISKVKLPATWDPCFFDIYNVMEYERAKELIDFDALPVFTRDGIERDIREKRYDTREPWDRNKSIPTTFSYHEVQW